MNKLSCDVVTDLLPLYYDQVCSPASREAVETHLQSCDKCRAAFNKLQQSSTLSFEVMETNKQEASELGSLKTIWKKTRAKAFLKGLLLAVMSCAVILIGYTGLTQWNLLQVPKQVIELTQVSQLRDGRIAYHVKMTDGYRVTQVNKTTGEDGSVYLTPVRPIIKSKKFAEISLANMYDSIDLEHWNANQPNSSGAIQAIYYGPVDDPLLIWEQGMELPPASDSLEAHFSNEG